MVSLHRFVRVAAALAARDCRGIPYDTELAPVNTRPGIFKSMGPSELIPALIATGSDKRGNRGVRERLGRSGDALLDRHTGGVAW